MKFSEIRLAAAILVFSGLFIIWAGTRKTVTLIVNGNRSSIETHRLRVVDLLDQQNLYPAARDRISLSLSTWLVNDDIVRLDQAASVIIYADATLSYLKSIERIPANLLAEGRVQLFPGDRVLVNGKQVDPAKALPFNPVYRIQVVRSANLLVASGANSIELNTTAPTIAQALANQKINLHVSDWISRNFDEPLKNDTALDYRLTRKIQLTTNTGTDVFYSAAPTIGAVLAEQGISLQNLDYTRPALFEQIPTDGQVQLVRVSEEVIIEQEPIAFETVLEPASDVELDTRVTLQPGEYGLMARRVRVRIEDGVEITRKTEAEWIARPVKNKIVGYGTKIVIKSLSTPEGPIEYWRSVSMYATSYSPCRIFKDRCDSYTASGAELKKGIVAMRGYWYRYYGGTQVYVPGYGFGTVADVGGGIPGQFWIDLGYSDSDYVSWHQMVTVYFLTPVPDQIPYIVQ